jgi:hypothetical protein
MSQESVPVEAFGKIVFVPKDDSIPPLPAMSLLFLNEKERGEMFPYRAVCIDLEIDACGNSMTDAWDNLKKSLTMYIDAEKTAASGSIIDAAKKITRDAFADSSQKKNYIDIYRQAKFTYTMKNIESGRLVNPIQEERARLKKLSAEKDFIRFVVDELKAA